MNFIEERFKNFCDHRKEATNKMVNELQYRGVFISKMTLEQLQVVVCELAAENKARLKHDNDASLHQRMSSMKADKALASARRRLVWVSLFLFATAILNLSLYIARTSN